MRALEGGHITYLVMKWQGLSFARVQRAVLWGEVVMLLWRTHRVTPEHRSVLAFLGWRQLLG